MPREHQYYVYILSNKFRTCFYIGVNNNMANRLWQHKNKTNPNSFTARYNTNQLIYYEIYQYIQDAIAREKELKGWRREKKIKLIKIQNPELQDLSNEAL